MYILNKEELKNEFSDYEDLALKLGYKNSSIFREDRGAKILDEGTVICPNNIKKAFDKQNYKNLYWTVDERILINSMIRGKFVMINDVMRVVVGLMLDGLTKKPAKIDWTINELVESSELRINGKNIENIITGEGKEFFICNQDTKRYSLNIEMLIALCK